MFHTRDYPCAHEDSAAREHGRYSTGFRVAGIEAWRSLGCRTHVQLNPKKEVRALQDFYTQQRPAVVQAFIDQGFAIDSQDIRIRIDDENRTLVLGVRFTNAEIGHRLYWANLTGGYDGRGAPAAELSSVLEADKGSILLWIVVELIILAVVWGLPYVSNRRHGGTAN